MPLSRAQVPPRMLPLSSSSPLPPNFLLQRSHSPFLDLLLHHRRGCWACVHNLRTLSPLPVSLRIRRSDGQQHLQPLRRLLHFTSHIASLSSFQQHPSHPVCLPLHLGWNCLQHLILIPSAHSGRLTSDLSTLLDEQLNPSHTTRIRLNHFFAGPAVRKSAAHQFTSPASPYGRQRITRLPLSNCATTRLLERTPDLGTYPPLNPLALLCPCPPPDTTAPVFVGSAGY